MCGRYAQYSPADAVADLFGATLEIEGLAPRYNAAPLQWLPVILVPEVVDLGLDRVTDPARLSELLMPCPAERFAMHPVSRAVGNVHRERQELIAEVSHSSPAHPAGGDPSGRTTCSECPDRPRRRRAHGSVLVLDGAGDRCAVIGSFTIGESRVVDTV